MEFEIASKFPEKFIPIQEIDKIEMVIFNLTEVLLNGCHDVKISSRAEFKWFNLIKLIEEDGKGAFYNTYRLFQASVLKAYKYSIWRVL